MMHEFWLGVAVTLGAIGFMWLIISAWLVLAWRREDRRMAFYRAQFDAATNDTDRMFWVMVANDV